MKLIQNLLKLSEAKEDGTLLPDGTMDELRKNITSGAKDEKQLWANALELVHRAYEVSGVQRPTPDMRSGWRQYEENIQYAVTQLSKYRGIDGDWRMSSHEFHESMEPVTRYRIAIVGDDFGESHTVNAKSLDEVLDMIKTNNSDGYDVNINKANSEKAHVTFSKWGIRKNYKLQVERIIRP